MSWTRSSAPWRAAIALALACAAGTAGAEVLVVRSSGPSASSYPPGRQLASTAKIDLKANDTIVVLDAVGTRTLRGPGQFSVAASSDRASDARNTFAALVTQRAERRARIGAVRNGETAAAGEQPRNPSIWYADLRRSGRICMRAGGKVTLWRPETKDPLEATITAPDGNRVAVGWASGQATAPWPDTLQPVPGNEYALAWQKGTQTTRLTFVPIGPDPAGLEEMASALVRNGCQAQLDLLIETVASQKEQPAGAG